MLRSLLQELREFLATSAIMIVTAILVVIFLYDQVLEAYPVPTRSMEPTIEGDPLAGDRVLVDKTWDNLRSARRFDQVVFWRAEDEKTLVKRIVGLPGEWIQIRKGDLFAGPTEDSMERIEKTPCADYDLLARLWDSRLQPNWKQDWRMLDGSYELLGNGRVEVRPGQLEEADLFEIPEQPRASGCARWSLSYDQRIQQSYLDGFDKLQVSRFIAQDFGMVAKLRISTGSTKRTIVWGQLRHGKLSIILEYAAVGRARIWIVDSHGSEAIGNTDGYEVPALRLGADQEVRFFHLDGGICLSVAGKDLIRIPFDSKRIEDHMTEVPMNGLSIATTKGSITIESFSIQHDFLYTSSDQRPGAFAVTDAYYVPQGHYFVLGDNSEDSEDSRFFGSIPKKDVRGRPWMVVAPISRFRIFPR